MAMLLLQAFCIFLLTASQVTLTLARVDTYIIHMDISAMPKAFSSHHDWFLATLSSVSNTSKTQTRTNHVYTYTNSIHGFCATLTNSELELLKRQPGYVSCTRDHPLTIHSTHTSQFLGLSSASGAWPASNYGENIIIGVVDTGVWPESKSFNDDGMSGVPTRWKGRCESGIQFNASLCNKKLIGARFFNRGLRASNPKLRISMNSPRDTMGHGTHTSSTAAGNYVKGASYFGYAPGTARGMAPRAHIAMYKAVWKEGVYTSDVIAAIDQAIADGVDILSFSLGITADSASLLDDPVAVATFAAIEKGLLVVASAGNEGPYYWTAVNGAPWLLTVGAGTIDRAFEGILSLGNGAEFTFASLYPGNFSQSQLPLIFMDACQSVTDMKKAQKKIIVCRDHQNFKSKVENAVSAGVYGAVFITNFSLAEPYIRSSFPAAFVGLEDGQKVLDYTRISLNPKASFRFQKTIMSIKPAPKVDSYSSRGPFLSCPSILKPDILAPGTLVLASWSPINAVAELHLQPLHSNFNLVSGTSMAAPHIAGVAALIKRAHPDWSPAAVRSALMTTANVLDNNLSPIKDAAYSKLPAASPLDIGAGHINPNKAIDPGLIYDATAEDYVRLLCAMKYTSSQIRIITRSSPNCTNKSLDLNYPSFVAFFNDDEVSDSGGTMVHKFRRTVTNVGEGGFTYTAKLTGMNGVRLEVDPPKLVFKQKYEKQSYTLTLEGQKLLEEVVHGSLSWVDDAGRYVVRSPIVATSLVAQSALRA